MQKRPGAASQITIRPASIPHRVPGVDWRVHGVFDLGCGCFSIWSSPIATVQDRWRAALPIDGEIRIGDRGFAKAGVPRQWCELGGGKADFVVRMSWRTFALTPPEGQPFDISTCFEGLPDGDGPHEVTVLSKAGKAPPLRLHLVVMRKPPGAIDAARRRLRRHATRQQRKLDPRTLEAANVLVLATSLSADHAACDICAAYRLRWQIELAFKRLKSLLHIDLVPTRTAQASRSWLLTHLILALLTEDVSRHKLESFPSGAE